MHQKKKQDRSMIMLRRYFALGALEGILCFLLLLVLPADQKNAWILGFSRLRVFMLGVALAGILFFGYLTRKSNNQDWARKTRDWVDQTFQSEKFSVVAITFLLTVFILGLVFLYSSLSPTNFVIRPHLLRTSELIRTFMDRLAPFVAWLTGISLQTIILLSVWGYGTKDRYYKVVRTISIAIFPLLIGVILIIVWIDDKYYAYLTNEDNLVEWLTFACLVLAGLFSLLKAYRARKVGSRYFWFYLLFGIGSIILGFEEISWGQRVFQIESSEFFMENSDQQEINVHNVVNLWFNVRTKHVAAFVLFLFGVGLPLAALNPKMKSLFEKLCIVVPPLFLSFGFVIGAFLTLDIFSGREEEVAELFLSLSLFLFIILENLKSDELAIAHPKPDSLPIRSDA